jgi:hypothetical protein
MLIQRAVLGEVISIGDVSMPLLTPKHIELVPHGYIKPSTFESQSILQNLRWIMQKDMLGSCTATVQRFLQ